jgi:hypothetical protein
MIGLLILAASGPARAGEDLAEALGDVLASEDICNLHYDQDAIKKFIDAHVKADDMEFPSRLKSETSLSRYANKKMSQSEKTAHCAQISRVARSYGFIQ